MRTAVATFGFGRPDHFERMLRSLGSCPEVAKEEVDVHHFLDGGAGSEQDALRAVIEASGVPYTAIVARPENLGVGRQLIGARRELLDEQGYDRMVLVEDDIELSPTYLTTLLRLSDWAENYADVGTVQVWNVESGTKDELQPHLHQVELTNRHFNVLFNQAGVGHHQTHVVCVRGELPHATSIRKTPSLSNTALHAKTNQATTPNSTRHSIGPPAQAIHNPFPPSLGAQHQQAKMPSLHWRCILQASTALRQGSPTPTTMALRAFTALQNFTNSWDSTIKGGGSGFSSEHFEIRYKDENGEWLSSFYR